MPRALTLDRFLSIPLDYRILWNDSVLAATFLGTPLLLVTAILRAFVLR
jgi:hypothetical protein